MGIPKAYPENPCTLVLGSVKTKMDSILSMVTGVNVVDNRVLNVPCQIADGVAKNFIREVNKMGIDEQYEQYQQGQVCEDLSHACDLILQQLDDVGSVALGDLKIFRTAVKNFDYIMGFNNKTEEAKEK